MTSILSKINSILSTAERLRFFYVVLGALLMAALEVVGIGTIVAFMGILAHPDLILENPWLNKLYVFLRVDNAQQFIVGCGFALLIVYLVRNLFAAFMVWLEMNFVWGTLYSLSNRLLEKYIYRPYSYFLTRNSADLQKNLLSEMNHVVNGIVTPATRLITQSILGAGVLALLFWNDPILAAAVALVFGSTYALIYFGFRHRLSRIGAKRVAANKLRFKALSEALGGIKEVRLSGREDYFTDNYSRALESFTRQMIAGNLITQIPKFLVEALAFGGILAIALYIVGVKQSMQDIIPVATLYAMATYRILPAFQQITKSLSALRFNRKSLDVIVYDLAIDDSAPDAQQVKAIRQRPIAYRDAISLKDVSFRYPAAQQDAIQRLTLRILKNTSVGFVGPTGAGKSTAADIILGLLIPQSGEVEIDDTRLSELTAPAWQLSTGYVPQQIFLADDSVSNNIAFGVQPEDIDQGAVIRAARAAHIHDFVTNELPDGYDTLVGERGIRLSGGQRQRIAVARALYHNPEMLVFDEATSALDSATEAIISQSVHELGGTRTLIIIAHRLTTVKDCDVIHVFDHGRIVASGSYQELIENSEEFRQLAQIPAATAK